MTATGDYKLKTKHKMLTPLAILLYLLSADTEAQQTLYLSPGLTEAQTCNAMVESLPRFREH